MRKQENRGFLRLDKLDNWGLLDCGWHYCVFISTATVASPLGNILKKIEQQQILLT